MRVAKAVFIGIFFLGAFVPVLAERAESPNSGDHQAAGEERPEKKASVSPARLMNALSACLLGREGGAVLPVPEETAPSKKAKSSNPPSGNGSVPSLSAAVGAGAAAAGKATEASGASSAGKAVEGAGANSAAASKAGSRSGSSAKDSNVAVLESLIQIKCSTCHGSGAFSFSAGDSLSSIKLSFTSKNKKGRTSGTISAEEILDALTTYPEMEKFAAKLTTSEKAALEAWKRN